MLTGRDLTIDQTVAVARAPRETPSSPAVSLATDAVRRMEASRAVIEELVAAGQIAYGVTTGFGDLATRTIDPEQSDRLQTNLLVSHAVGVGRPLEREVVRAMLLLRANTLALGYSGCRVVVVERLLDLLRLGIHPVVPAQGSVGASGDLAPLAHLALPIVGRGQVESGGRLMPAVEALREAGLEPLHLGAKEGLALLNGTQMMSAIGVLVLHDAERLLGTASAVAAMSIEALQGTDVPFAAAYQDARPHPGQAAVAAELRHLLRESGMIRAHRGTAHKVQDPYSLRCIPQVHGAARDAIGYLRGVLEIEINAATDNPLVFPEGDAADREAVATGGGRIVSGGNFHGEPVAIALDLAKIALAELASISERRTALLVDGHLSGLPPFLAVDAGLNSGFMVLQYTAASLVSESKSLAHPASVDSIPSSAGQEDHVSMGMTSARHARDIVTNAEHVLAMEALAAAQALDLREPLVPGAATQAVRDAIRATVPFFQADREFGPDIADAVAMVRSGTLVEAAESATGPLE